MKEEELSKISCLFIAIMIFSIAGCELPWDSSSVSEPVICVVPRNREVMLNERFSLEITAVNVSNLFATPFYILYDTNYLKFDMAEEGTFLNRNNMDSTSFLFSNDLTRGQIIVGLTRLGRAQGVNGSGLLMTVYFKAIKKGISSLYFDHASAKALTENDSPLESVPASFIGSTINVK